MYQGAVCYEIYNSMNQGHPNFTAAFPGTTISVVPDPEYVFKTGSGLYNSTITFPGSGAKLLPVNLYVKM
jgi:hypothetical protein